MKNIVIRNVGTCLLIVVAFSIAYIINYAELTWYNRDIIRVVVNYLTVAVMFIAGVYLLIINFMAFKQPSNSKGLSIFNGLFFVAGIAVVVYSLFMFMVIVAFRNGFN